MIAPLGRLLDFSGRSTPAAHWPFMGLLIAIYVVATMLVLLLGPVRAALLAIFLLMPLLAGLAFASVVRRLHDIDWSGRWMAAFVVMVAANSAFYFYYRYGMVRPLSPDSQALMFRIGPTLMIASFAMWGLGILIFVLNILDGTAGPNRFGPNPRYDDPGPAGVQPEGAL